MLLLKGDAAGALAEIEQEPTPGTGDGISVGEIGLVAQGSARSGKQGVRLRARSSSLTIHSLRLRHWLNRIPR